MARLLIPVLLLAIAFPAAAQTPPAEEAPAKEKAADDAPADYPPAEDAPAEDAPLDDAPAEAALAIWAGWRYTLASFITAEVKYTLDIPLDDAQEDPVTRETEEQEWPAAILVSLKAGGRGR